MDIPAEPVIRTNAPPIHFISVIPSLADRTDFLAEHILRRNRRTGITRFALSCPLHPQGNDLFAKADAFARMLHEVKHQTGGHPVEIGVLFQSTLGHGGYFNLVPENALRTQHAILKDGTVSARPCPFDPEFLAFIEKSVRTIVLEHPDFTLVDDDVRTFDQECFCPLHLEALRRRTGKLYTREELVSLLDNAGPGDPFSQAVEDVNIESMTMLCKAVRKALDSVDPTIPCGCCIVRDRIDFAESECKALAGEQTKSFLRISNGNYLEQAVKSMAEVDFATAFQSVNMKPLGMDLLDESDTCPHNRYSKTARTMHLHIVSGLLHGLDGGKLWLDGDPMPESSFPYENILAKYQGQYRELHRLMQNVRKVGPVTHIPPIRREPYPLRGMKFWRQSDWGKNCLAQFGIPIRYEDMKADGIHLLAGSQVSYYTDEEIRTMLSGSALIDGEAAAELTKRGFSELTGVRAVIAQPGDTSAQFQANIEIPSGTDIRMTFPCRDRSPFLTADERAEVLSEVCFSQNRVLGTTYVMPGSTFFRNSLGGKVIVMSMNIGSWHYMAVLNNTRKLQILNCLKRLGGLPAWLPEFQNAKFVCGLLPDSSLLCTAINYSYDPLPLNIGVDRPVSQVFELMPEGDFRELEFSRQDHCIHLDHELEPAQYAILKLVF